MPGGDSVRPRAPHTLREAEGPVLEGGRGERPADLADDPVAARREVFRDDGAAELVVAERRGEDRARDAANGEDHRHIRGRLAKRVEVEFRRAEGDDGVDPPQPEGPEQPAGLVGLVQALGDQRRGGADLVAVRR